MGKQRFGPTERLVLALFHDWQPKRIFMIVSVYIDESGTHGGSPLTVMAGYVGRAGPLKKFDKSWETFLKENNLEYLRTHELWQRKKLLKRIDTIQRWDMWQSAQQIIQAHMEFGCVVALKEDDYLNHYRSLNKDFPTEIDTRYGLCFSLVLRYLPKLTKRLCNRRCKTPPGRRY